MNHQGDCPDHDAFICQYDNRGQPRRIAGPYPPSLAYIIMERLEAAGVDKDPPVSYTVRIRKATRTRR